MGSCIGIGIIFAFIIFIASSGKSSIEMERDKIQEVNSSRKPYDTVRVEELEDDYKANDLSARIKYNGRKLRLIGRLSDFSLIGDRDKMNHYHGDDSYFYKTSGGCILTLGRETDCFFKCDSASAKQELDKRILQLRKGQMIMSIEGVWIDESAFRHWRDDNIAYGIKYRPHGLYDCKSWSVIG